MGAPTNASDTAHELFWQHGAAVYRFVAVLLRHREDTEDVLQETFLKLLKHLGSGGSVENIRAWLFTVAAHAARDRQRRRTRWIPWGPSHEAIVAPPALPDESGRLRIARQALRRLPPRDRLLLALRAQDLSYRDIAAAAGIRPTSVGRLLARAVSRWERECAQALPLDASGAVNPERRGLL